MLCKLGFPGAQMVRNPPAMQETRAQSLGREDPLEKGMATHSSVLAKNFQDSGAWRATDHRVSESRHNRAMCTFCFPVLLTKPQIPLQDVCEAGSDSSCPQFSEKGELRTRRESGGRRFPNQAGLSARPLPSLLRLSTAGLRLSRAHLFTHAFTSHA